MDIRKLFELEIAQWAEVDLRVAPRLVADAAGAGGVGLHGDFNMTGSYDEWEEARRLVERGERKLSDYGGELPGTEPPEEWKRYFDWQRQFRIGSAS